MEIVSITNLSFSYAQQLVLEDVSLHVEKGDFLAIIGPNGGGKSTLLKLLLGLKKPQEGSIKVFENPPEKSLSSIGYVPQNTNINTDFPIQVIDVVLMGHVGDKPPLIGYKKSEIACGNGALRQVGMEEFAKKKIGDLSGGQRQRVMIARALCAHPKLLLLDEPTANIDTDGQKQIYELLKELNEHITIIVVSHDLSLTLQYANKVAHINKKITLHNPPKQKNNFFNDNKHFCEIELLEALEKKGIHD